MTRKRTLVIALAVVAMIALLAAGTSYARSLSSPAQDQAVSALETEDPAGSGLDCDGSDADGVHATMHAGADTEQNMTSLHNNMHGTDSTSGESCHKDGATGMMGDGAGSPSSSMMGGGMHGSGGSMMGQQS